MLQAYAQTPSPTPTAEPTQSNNTFGSEPPDMDSSHNYGDHAGARMEGIHNIDRSKNLTNDQQDYINNYVDLDHLQQAVDEDCSAAKQGLRDEGLGKKEKLDAEGFDQNDFDPCDESSVDDVGAVFGKNGDMMVEMAAQMLQTLVPMLAGAQGGAGSIKTKPGKGKDGGDSRDDMCIYIPIAGRMAAQITQQVGESDIMSQPVATENQQKETYYRMADLHGTRKRTANMEGGVFAATGGCYIAQLTTGAKFNLNIGVKLGAAAFLSSFYFIKGNRHKRAEEFYRNRGDKWKYARGQCNPITERACYCSVKPERKSEELCKPPEYRNKVGKGPFVSCVDANLKEDAECKCAENNTCFSQKLAHMAFKGGFGSAFMDMTGMKGLNGMYNGRYDEGALLGTSSQINARAKKVLKEMAKKMKGPMPPLTSAQKKMAKELFEMGYPARIAAGMAKLPSSKKGRDRLGLAGLTRKGIFRSAKRSVGSRRKARARYGKSKSLNQIGKKNKRRKGFSNGRLSGSTSKVLKFAERASRNATQIEMDEGKPIFEIISHRYRKSGRRRLELENN